MIVTGDDLCDMYSEGSVSCEGWLVLSTQYFPILSHYYLHSFAIIIHPCICQILKAFVKLLKRIMNIADILESAQSINV